MRDQPVARPLPEHRIAQTQSKRTQTSMPQVGFEPTIPVFERAKTIHALDPAAIVIGNLIYTKFYKDWFKHSKSDRGGNTYRHTYRQQGDLISPRLFFFFFFEIRTVD
jgi:hypothetical protein